MATLSYNTPNGGTLTMDVELPKGTTLSPETEEKFKALAQNFKAEGIPSMDRSNALHVRSELWRTTSLTHEVLRNVRYLPPSS